MICRPDKLSLTILIPNLNNASPRLIFLSKYNLIAVLQVATFQYFINSFCALHNIWNIFQSPKVLATHTLTKPFYWLSLLIWAAEAKFIHTNYTKCLSVCALEVYYSACVATLCLWRGSTAFVTKLIYRHIMSYLPCVRIDWTLLLPTQFKAFSPENIYILMKTPTIPKFNFKWWS